MSTKLLIQIYLVFAPCHLFAQAGVIISNSQIPNEPGAILNVHATDQGVLLPRTRVDSIDLPAHGMIVFDTIENSFMFFDSSNWVALLKATDFSFYYADRDGDDYGDPYAAIFSLQAPPGYVTELDCNDADPDIAPGMPELCDNIDNDCDPDTEDGSDALGIGSPCDGMDDDPCEEGIIQCINGNLVCSDTTGTSAEICGDGIDNDCDDIIDLDCIEIIWAILQFPPSIEMGPGNTPLIYGQVYSPNVTDMPGQGPGITAQVGYGIDGSDPSMGGWIWVNATYNVDVGNNDEYQVMLTINNTGVYDYAYRFSGDAGFTWTYADLDGTDDGYDPTDAGSLTVSVSIDYAVLQHPPSIVMPPGTTPTIYGRVFSVGLTESLGQGIGITAQVGYGPDGSDPSMGGWTWVNATFNVDVENNDEYQATFIVSQAGEYDYAYRFSGNGGATWVYADLDGTTDGYDPADAGSLTIN